MKQRAATNKTSQSDKENAVKTPAATPTETKKDSKATSKTAQSGTGLDKTQKIPITKPTEKKKDTSKKTDTQQVWIMKAVALAVLSVQHCCVGLITRQSRTTGTGQFLTQTGVICQEILKGGFCLVCVVSGGESVIGVFSDPKELLRASVPAVLYLVQNNLQYVALGYLDPATYVVTYQLKILSTAVMSVLLLNRELSIVKWLALSLLVAGVSTVQLSAMSTSDSLEAKESARSQQMIGLAAVLTTCAISGVAGVYTEKILKTSSVSLWARNVQLAVFSIISGVLGLCFTGDFAKVGEHGFFQGYNAWVCASVVNNAFGGLLIAAIIKYADNIIKNFATAISIVMTTAVSTYALGLTFTYNFFVGVAVVCCSTFLYGGLFDGFIGSMLPATKKS